jgi:uncharacterized damage-inducible protein DinB
MSVTFHLEELLDYCDHERAKWKAWVAADPARLQTQFQSGGRYSTIGVLFDHVFLVERRHLSRLQGAVPPESTGVREGDWPALFEYGDLVRADLRRYAADLGAEDAGETLTFSVQSGGPFTMSRRKLLVHVVLHEVRHFAQIAYAARLAGHEPPGQHDIFYFPELV